MAEFKVPVDVEIEVVCTACGHELEGLVKGNTFHADLCPDCSKELHQEGYDAAKEEAAEELADSANEIDELRIKLSEAEDRVAALEGRSKPSALCESHDGMSPGLRAWVNIGGPDD